MNERQRWGLAAVGLGLVLMLALLVVGACAPEKDEIVVALGVTHFSGLDVTGTETDLLVVDQTSTGDIVELRDNGTVVWRVADGGAVTQSGATDLSGNLSSSVGAITMTDDVAITGTLDVDGAVTLNSTLDVDGNISSGTGGVTLTDNVDITGTLDVDGAVTLNSTLDVDGNISSGTGAITMTDDVNITGTLTLAENAIEPDDVAVMHDVVILCGQADENGTIYYGPATAVFGGDGSTSYAISSAGCDALDNATEATADAPIMTNVAFKITGVFCKQSGTLGSGESVTFTVRSAAADTTPVISCVISEGETDCRSLTASTTDIAAGATIAIKAVQASDNSDDDHWCKLGIAYK